MTPITTHTITLTIDSTDRTGLLLRDSIFVRSSIGNTSDVAEFDLRDPTGSYTPPDWGQVTISVDGTAIFGGYIVQRDEDSIGAGANKTAVWHVTCKDWSILLDRVLVTRQYTQAQDSGIIADLVATYLNGEGFDAGSGFTSLLNDVDINFEEVTVREAFDELAGRAGAKWHIAPDKVIWWNDMIGAPLAAFQISETPNGTTTFAPLESTLKRSVDASQIINKVRVIGAEDTSTVLQVDSWTADGAESVFGPLTKKPHSLWLVQYTVNVGGGDINVSAYASQIGIEHQDKLLVDGGDKTVLANLEARTLTVTDINGENPVYPKAGTQVVCKYYYTTPIEVTVEDTSSQFSFGRTFETSVYDEKLTSTQAATQYGNSVLDEYAWGRQTVEFQVTRHGLLPGRRIAITSTTLDILGTYLIQEVDFTAVAVGHDQFMVVARVQCGEMKLSLFDSLRPTMSAGAGRLPAKTTPGRLSQIATDMGDIVAGRAMFTDGGTARFAWGTPNGATGVVIGLEDAAGTVYGANYIYDGGTVRAKLGRLTGLPNLGTVTPSGWGIYTDNGYFSGKLVASHMYGGTVEAGVFNGGNINQGTIAAAVIQGATIEGGTITAPYISGGTISGISLVGQQITGGTITGAYISGGTLSGQVGTIGGFRLENNLLWSDGGTIATGSVVNSANPGVYMTNTGLFGFGTLGMTFGLWTDPAKAPYLSSGTINNVVYEVYESAVIRTNADPLTNGGIQIDNSGIFGISPITGLQGLTLENGDEIQLENGEGVNLAGMAFALDAVTGKLYAENAYIHGTVYATDGRFTGTVAASQIIGGTVTGGVFTGGTVSQGTISAAKIVGGTVQGATFDGGNLSDGTISAALVTGGTVSGALVSGGTISGATFSGGTVTSGTISAMVIQGGTVQAGRFAGGTIAASKINGGTISASYITGGTIDAVTFRSGTAGAQTMTLDDDGLSLSASSYDSRIRWMIGTAPVRQQYNLIFAGNMEAREVIGIYNPGTANVKQVRVHSSTANYTELKHSTTGWTFWDYTPAGDTYHFIIGTANIVPYHNFRPDASSSNLTLGDSTHAWRYLYLYDGTDEWRISINTGGTLVATKV